MLWQRGLECKGCTEKADFVQLLQDHISDPIIQGGSSSKSDSSSDSGGGTDKDKELADLMKKLEVEFQKNNEYTLSIISFPLL